MISVELQQILPVEPELLDLSTLSEVCVLSNIAILSHDRLVAWRSACSMR